MDFGAPINSARQNPCTYISNNYKAPFTKWRTPLQSGVRGRRPLPRAFESSLPRILVSTQRHPQLGGSERDYNPPREGVPTSGPQKREVMIFSECGKKVLRT